jgi:hypothetical protein
LTGPIFARRKPLKAATKLPLSAGPGSPPPATGASLPLPTGRLGRAIVSFLRGVFPRTEQPKTIARQIKEKHASVRREIGRLEERGFVVNVDETGWYRAWADPRLLAFAERPEPSVHGLQILAAVPLSYPSGVPRGLRQARLQGHEADGWHGDENGGNGQAVRHFWIEGRRVEFRASETGRLQISVHATDNPIRFEDWDKFVSELRGLAQGLGVDLRAPTTVLSNVEFNADWRQFFLSGVKRMKLAHVSTAWGQIYQKNRDALRMELRVAPQGLKFEEAAAALIFLTEYRVPMVPEVPAPSAPDPFSPEVA